MSGVGDQPLKSDVARLRDRLRQPHAFRSVGIDSRAVITAIDLQKDVENRFFLLYRS